MRNMNIEKWAEVQAVIWVKSRIMAIGWNRRVTEFADTGEAVGPGGAFRYKIICLNSSVVLLSVNQFSFFLSDDFK